MKKYVMLIFCVCFIFLAADNAFACLCDPSTMNVKKTVKRLRREATAIFAGKVKEIVKGFDKEGFFEYRITFEVQKSWKYVQSNEITIYSGGGCAAYFDIGDTFLVYAKNDNENKLRTDRCMRTRLLERASEDLKILGNPKIMNKGKAMHTNIRPIY